MNEIKINQGYELYQIITDFGDPLEIFREAFQNALDEEATMVFCNVHHKKRLSGSELYIDVWNNGSGLPKSKVSNFFDLANSTKIDEHGLPIKGKLGYKGHGAKIFFNSIEVQITSKCENEYWSVNLEKPIFQIETNSSIVYSDFKEPEELNLELPKDWKEGFFVRIIGHLHFKTEHTKFKLNHKNLRDYSKWFTGFGTIATLYDETLKNKDIKLYLHGIDFETFSSELSDKSIIPKPEVQEIDGIEYELIALGHYFPEQRYSDKDMKKYVKLINSNKPFWDYYSRLAYSERVSCDNNLSFYFAISIEGYETKREYDILLTRRGKPRTAISHNDSQRYGIWACKGGVPVEKIDDWIEGGKGQYSYLKAFVDCDEFNLTANRGSINNTEIEKIDLIKRKINEIFNSKKIKDLLNERLEIEKLETTILSIDEDGQNLEKRFKDSNKSKKIILPDEKVLKEPKKLKSGYSESETLILLIHIISNYPDLFPFQLFDYDTSKGIDFVVSDGSHPKYIELKGTMNKRINHPFRHIHKFITYDIGFAENEIIEDIESFKAVLKINRKDTFQSFNEEYKGKSYTSYKLEPNTAAINSMEVIKLKSILSDILGATFE